MDRVLRTVSELFYTNGSAISNRREVNSYEYRKGEAPPESVDLLFLPLKKHDVFGTTILLVFVLIDIQIIGRCMKLLCLRSAYAV